MIQLVFGILALNIVFLASGYCVLAGALKRLGPVCWLSYAGVALLVGTGLVGTAVSVATIAGATSGLATLFGSAAAVSALGIALACSSRVHIAVPACPSLRSAMSAEATATAACFGVVVISAVAIVGAFRASPWLDDAWGIWLPKGVALSRHGLDPRLFAPNGRYVSFEVPDYPLWWPALSGLAMRFVGSIDVRAMNAQLALLTFAFVGAVARLLWGVVRPWILWTGLLLLVASPEFLRHTQAGMADLPLAIYLSLCALAAVGWLSSGRGFYLLLAFAFAATALEIKTEGMPQLLILLLAATALAGGTRARVARLWAVAAAAFATFLPWLAWRAQHHIASRTGLGKALDPGYLSRRTDRLFPSVEALARELADPRNWLLLVPLTLAVALALALRQRRWVWLGAPATLAALFGFWVWAYWVDRDPIDYLLATSSYRVIDSIVLLAAVVLPVLSEGLARRLPDQAERSRDGRATRLT